MSIERLKGLLESIEILNHGVNHGCEYAIYQLPDAPDLHGELNLYFVSLRTGMKPAQPAEYWHIRTTELELPWRISLGKSLKHWFFEAEFSPKAGDWNQQGLVDQAMDYLIQEFGELSVVEVFVSPPMWYDCHWQDFAFTSSKGRWLLHLGFSD